MGLFNSHRCSIILCITASLLLVLTTSCSSKIVGGVVSISSPVDQTLTNLAVLEQMAKLYYEETGVLPHAEALLPVPDHLANQDNSSILIDGWGIPIRHKLKDGIEVTYHSFGADNKEGGQGDDEDMSVTFNIREFQENPDY